MDVGTDTRTNTGSWSVRTCAWDEDIHVDSYGKNSWNY